MQSRTLEYFKSQTTNNNSSTNQIIIKILFIIVGEIDVNGRIASFEKKYRIIMSNFVLKTESEQSDDDILLPINTLYPPNDIITKKYAPDVKPTFKLISSEKRQRKRVTIQNQTFAYLGQHFEEGDTLGYEYSSLLRSRLVYLRFNSSQLMKLQLNNRSVKYLAGVFIPFQRLISDSLKRTKNIYKIINSLDYVDNKYPIQTSFSSNCRSEPPAVRFSSNYEGSNLFAVIKVAESEYDLILQNDTNSKGNTQWFNFAVELPQDRNYKFNIVNLTKSSSLYQKGMNVVYYSQQQKLNYKIGWTKGGHSISYQCTTVARQHSQSNFYYCLHFEYKSPYKNDVVIFANSFPYSLLDLEKYFSRVVTKKILGSMKVEKIKIAETLTGFHLNAYYFTHKKYHSKKLLFSSTTLERQHGVPSVIFMARQHPGQTQGSYVIEGIVEWLLEGEYDSWKKNYCFYVIPMINMDGVFYGNYRTNLSGNDLNRIWRQPRKDYHCQIYSLKKFLHGLNKSNPISLIIDIHGHSNSLNSFFYGNPTKKDNQNSKLFPYYCSRKIRQISFSQSTFSVSEDKKACARVVLGQMFPKALVYTFQNSFYGWRRGKSVVEHSVDSYRKLGRDLVQCFVEYARLCQKNVAIKEKWTKEIEDLKDNQLDEQIVSESDGQIENQLIDFPQLANKLIEDTDKQDEARYADKKKSMPSIGKNTNHRLLRRHSPLKLRSYCTSNDTYFLQKPTDNCQESQGFLSIVKINTRSYLDSLPDCKRKTSLNKEDRKYNQSKKDIVIQDLSDDKQTTKENESSIKVGRLINEKELIMEKMRQNRRKMEEGMIHARTHNGFFRYNYKRN